MSQTDSRRACRNHEHPARGFELRPPSHERLTDYVVSSSARLRDFLRSVRRTARTTPTNSGLQPSWTTTRWSWPGTRPAIGVAFCRESSRAISPLSSSTPMEMNYGDGRCSVGYILAERYIGIIERSYYPNPKRCGLAAPKPGHVCLWSFSVSSEQPTISMTM